MSRPFRHACSLLCLALLVLAGSGCNTTSQIARRAASGDAAAQFEYGRRLLTGTRAPKDPARALIWFHTAATLGHPKAIAAIGFCHERGLGTPVDLQMAAKWYEYAADAGETGAQFMLVGLNFKRGKTAQALHDLDLLSQGRNKVATKQLIKRYMDPKSPTYNPPKGIDHLRYAAMDGSKAAARELSRCYAEGIGVPKNPLLAEGWKNWEPGSF